MFKLLIIVFPKYSCGLNLKNENVHNRQYFNCLFVYNNNNYLKVVTFITQVMIRFLIH